MLIQCFITCQLVNLIDDESVFLSTRDYPFSYSLIRHLDGPIWLCLRQCLSCFLDRNSELPSTLLPLYDNKIMKM